MTEDAPTGFQIQFKNTIKQKRTLDFGQSQRGPRKELLTHIDAEGLRTADSRPQRETPRIIPRQENTFKISRTVLDVEDDTTGHEQQEAALHSGRKKLKPSFLPERISNQEDHEAHRIGIEKKFESSNVHDAGGTATEKVTYGLNKRAPPAKADILSDANPTEASDRIADRELAALHRDLHILPAEASLQDYESMPVDHFGEALLRGMGWSEEKGIGRRRGSASVPVRVLEPLRRPTRLGLGAAPPSEETTTTGATVTTSKTTASATIPLNPKAKKSTPEPMRKENDGPRNREAQEEEDLTTLSRTRRDRALERHNRSKHEDDRTNVGFDMTASRNERREASSMERETEKRSSWLVPGIRVKIVDEKLDKGRMYLKKGIVVDVKTPKLCDVWIPKLSRSLLDVRQSQLETVVPSTSGAPILVVEGEHRGRHGHVLQRNVDAGVAAVHLDEDEVIRKISLDDIAEWVGIDTDA